MVMEQGLAALASGRVNGQQIGSLLFSLLPALPHETGGLPLPVPRVVAQALRFPMAPFVSVAPPVVERDVAPPVVVPPAPAPRAPVAPVAAAPAPVAQIPTPALAPPVPNRAIRLKITERRGVM